jgi:hypothetical protein
VDSRGPHRRHLLRHRRRGDVPPTLIRTDQIALGETGAAVHVGETVIRFATDATITPAEARKLAEALVELADWGDQDTSVRPGMLRVAPSDRSPFEMMLSGGFGPITQIT